jgi:VIT1/CCC1 family predicted Fe2+/Mn2+ transporter
MVRKQRNIKSLNLNQNGSINQNIINPEKDFPYFILGFQDGLVNVFGVVLAVAFGTFNTAIVILAGLAATFAESISMGAVAYTSTKAERDYRVKRINELKRLRKKAFIEHLINSLSKFSIKGTVAYNISLLMAKNKENSINFIISQELKESTEIKDPLKYAIVVFISSLLGSLVPIASFFFLDVKTAIISTFIICAFTLFIIGIYKSSLYNTNPIKEGLELLFIGMASALLGFAIGYIFGVKS